MAAKQEKEAGNRSKRSALIGVAGLILGVTVGPKVLPDSGASEEVADASTTTLYERGPTVALPEITLNLADGRLLRLGLALQLPFESNDGEGEPEEAAADDEEAVEDLTLGHAQDLDAAISVFSLRTMEELLDGQGRESARTELLARIGEHHGAPTIEDVYFYQFVMQ